MDGFWAEMDRLGKDRNPYRAGFAQVVAVADSREQAMELYRRPAEYFFGRCLHIDPRFAAPPGYSTEATQRAGLTSMVKKAADNAQALITADKVSKAAGAGITMEEIVERGYAVVGSPDEVAEQLTQLGRDLNVGHLMLLMQFGDMGKELTARNTELFAQRVAPRLRGLFGEWEDRWWPKPMAPAERAAPSAFAPGLAAE
jgi:alkanesulfonate monooxygenase SsuD/methylene tetrahydromethanopterin reductase-like flavin-dependent oxidoreductase (luciferase family)